MPKQYTAMRDKFKKKGMGSKAAKTKAAKIYNSKNPENPVTRSHNKPARTKTENTSYTGY